MQPSTLVRGGALCGFLYTAVTIATTLYVESQPVPPTKSTLTSQQNDRILLSWVHQNASLMDVYVLSALAGFVLLGGVAFALYVMLRRPGSRMPLISLLMGVVGLSLSVVAAAFERLDYVQKAQQFANAHGSAAANAVVSPAVKAIVKSFESSAGRDYAIDTSGRFAVVFWIGMIGISLMALYGWKSTPALGSFATFCVGVLGFTPVFALWSAGAGFGLWRIAMHGMPEPPVRRDEPARATPPVHARSTWLSRVRPQPPGPIDVEAVDLDEAPPSRIVVASEPEPAPAAMASRPPRGTSIPRSAPAQAKGSKSSRPRKRR